MSLMDNFIALMVATTTAFTAGYANINIQPAPDKAYTYAVRNVEQANSISQGSGVTSGIVVIDRAKGNAMETNGSLAHQQFPLQTLAKLPILLYAVRVDPDVATEEKKDAISMIQGFSAEATNRMWEEYGGMSIIQDLAQRYNLQETTANDSWGTSTMSAVDVGRMIRRFMDDKQVSTKEKKWALDLLATTPLNISGQDLSYGIPGVITVNPEGDNSGRRDDRNTAAWMQGWSPSGGESMVRHTAGLVGAGYRFIVVNLGNMPATMSNADANMFSTQITKELLQGKGRDGAGGDGLTLGGDSGKQSEEIQRFVTSQEKYM